MNGALVDRLLRSPKEVAADCRGERATADIARASLAAIAFGAAVFGAVVGSWRGGWQIAFAALKLPLVTLSTFAVCAPAFYALAQVFGRPWPLRAVVSVMLAAGARLSLLLLATTPLLWLLINLGGSYPLVKVVAAAVYGCAGLAALGLLVRGLGTERGRGPILAVFVCLFMLVGGQTAWVLRPYIGVPGRSQHVALFTREREGGLVYQLFVAMGEILDPRSAARSR